MEKSRKRALRRHENQRLKNKRSKYYSYTWIEIETEDQKAKRLGIILNTARMCSCWMCGNPRKHFNDDTLKEKLHVLIMKEEVNEGFDRQREKVSEEI